MLHFPEGFKKLKFFLIQILPLSPLRLHKIDMVQEILEDGFQRNFNFARLFCWCCLCCGAVADIVVVYVTVVHF